MTSIALFGTSADPPTAGHQAVLAWLAGQFDQVAVWASDNPFKSHQTPLVHRAAMLQLLIEDIDPPRHNLCLEAELSHPRALITVQRARERWQDADFTLVIGSDLVAQLPRWYCIEELLQQVRLLVIPRPGYPLSEVDLEPLRQMGASVTIASIPVPDVSSTDYRKTRDAEAVIPPIEAYIHREQLYTWQDAAPKNLPTRCEAVPPKR
ncbi:nicotinate-nucleotide adenylyltransferase [Leptolyngbya sp. FACHB-711]|uniref:nicotinate-nucleotide adenylyltransferase n=1 Tax=unclassified Leptolyngbya TaxID=2650499 RepID=UPI00168A0C93|nr:nicotinate-nucleotide adenylyltransferase [Leptolyngbya sp. FACHB-711]MBD1848677.1 nicotinate-nucleotide adenylyltransferase [Cyanobacteria bacterium FACHB-502]MBD2027559.1 nicotinate-nucleotide adenylyltransferase [Leptolyngbya sp. FACHB-711]